MMAWRRIGDKPLSEPMFTRCSQTHIWGARGRWVNTLRPRQMAIILQTKLSNSFSSTKIVVFWFKFQLDFFPMEPIIKICASFRLDELKGSEKNKRISASLLQWGNDAEQCVTRGSSALYVSLPNRYCTLSVSLDSWFDNCCYFLVAILGIWCSESSERIILMTAMAVSSMCICMLFVLHMAAVELLAAGKVHWGTPLQQSRSLTASLTLHKFSQVPQNMYHCVSVTLWTCMGYHGVVNWCS